MWGAVKDFELISGDQGTRPLCRWTVRCVWNGGRPPSDVCCCASSKFGVLGQRQTSVCASCVGHHGESSCTEHLDTWWTWAGLRTRGRRDSVRMTRWTGAGWTRSRVLAGSESADDTSTRTHTHTYIQWYWHKQAYVHYYHCVVA